MHSKIVLATGNKGKLKELQPLLSTLGIELIAQSELNVPKHEETGLSFIENAISKARWAAKYTNLPAIGDDSGLVVQALNGEPGIYSSRYAGIEASDDDNIDKLLSTLSDTSDRSAYFYCAMTYVADHDDPTPILALGHCPGEILTERHGQNGFGYDPIFYLPAFAKTAAELTEDEKNRVSHRAKACEALLKQLRELKQ